MKVYTFGQAIADLGFKKAAELLWRKAVQR